MCGNLVRLTPKGHPDSASVVLMFSNLHVSQKEIYFQYLSSKPEG